MLTTGQIDSVDDVMFLMVKINGFIQVVPVNKINSISGWLFQAFFIFNILGTIIPFD